MKTKLEMDDEIEEFRGKSRMKRVFYYLWRRIKPIDQIIASLVTEDLKKNNILFTPSKSKLRRVEEGLLSQEQTTENYLAETPNKSMVKDSAAKVNAGAFTALNISSDSPQSSKTDMEIENTQSVSDAFGAKDEAQKAFKLSCQPSQNALPNMKTQKKSQSNVSHLLLLIAALLSTITFLSAVKILGCRSEESYKYNALLNPICQIVNQHPYIFRLVIAFNSIVFFLSIALMMILFNELPLRPLLILSAFSLLGTYLCIILSH